MQIKLISVTFSTNLRNSMFNYFFGIFFNTTLILFIYFVLLSSADEQVVQKKRSKSRTRRGLMQKLISEPER